MYLHTIYVCTHIYYSYIYEQIVNYDEVRQAIVEKLEMLRDSPVRDEPPIIYHLDVGKTILYYVLYTIICTVLYDIVL